MRDLLFQFVEQSNQTNDATLLFQNYQNAMEHLGYDRLLFALFNNHHSLGLHAKHGLLYNYPEDWLEYYAEQGYENIDPVRQAVFVHNGLFTWQDIINQSELTAKQQRIFDEGEDAHFYEGVGIPLRGVSGELAGIGAARSVKDEHITEEMKSIINFLSCQFYWSFCRLHQEKSTMYLMPLLTEREKDVLKWAAHGLTKLEIANKLNLSAHTIDFHFRQCFKKLQSRNITSAVAKAITMQLISL